MSFSEHDWQLLAQYWYPIALARDITEQPLGTMLLDMPLVIYKINSEIIVAKDACPHRGVPLSIGTNDGQVSFAVIMVYALVKMENVIVTLRIPIIKFRTAST